MSFLTRSESLLAEFDIRHWSDLSQPRTQSNLQALAHLLPPHALNLSQYECPLYFQKLSSTLCRDMPVRSEEPRSHEMGSFPAKIYSNIRNSGGGERIHAESSQVKLFNAFLLAS